MELIKGIEGDYLETKQNNLIFDVKGLHHPKDRKICFLRFYPSPEGDRKREGKIYKKVYNLNERYSILRKEFPQYLFFSKEIDLEVQGVKNEDIKNIYSPREYYQRLTEKTNLTKLENYSKELCELCISEGDVPESSIGITGSQMVGINKDDSDIDLIIYGTETGLEFQEKLKKIFEKSNECRKYTIDEYKIHYNWRIGGSQISFEDFLKSERRKLHQGKFKDVDFYIRYIKSPQDWEGNYYDSLYKNYGRIKLKAVILDTTYSIFTPCSYKIEVSKILENNLASHDYIIEDITDINSFRGRFCEQAKKGEEILVEGKLEKAFFRNKEYYRVLLFDQVKDKMVILNK